MKSKNSKKNKHLKKLKNSVSPTATTSPGEKKRVWFANDT